jgi:hypothetical protein
VAGERIEDLDDPPILELRPRKAPGLSGEVAFILTGDEAKGLVKGEATSGGLAGHGRRLRVGYSEEGDGADRQDNQQSEACRNHPIAILRGH